MSYWLASPVTSSRWLRGVIRWSYALGGGHRRTTAPSHLPSKQTIMQVMLEVDAERRAAGLPVPDSGLWKRLRRKHSYDDPRSHTLLCKPNPSESRSAKPVAFTLQQPDIRVTRRPESVATKAPGKTMPLAPCARSSGANGSASRMTLPKTEAVVRRPVSTLARQLAAMDRGVAVTSCVCDAAGSGRSIWGGCSGRGGAAAAVSRRAGGLRGGAAGRWA